MSLNLSRGGQRNTSLFPADLGQESPEQSVSRPSQQLSAELESHDSNKAQSEYHPLMISWPQSMMLLGQRFDQHRVVMPHQYQVQMAMPP
ncbi:hypothetical protein BN11_4780005 [Nostocoides australiense Ben110]|uniref:Uncharacterized protein n=1 Tax=Nostocoides australiense Ben110 TaxID=1193182 RepID=W6JZV9_9MICO|nr:hypothetical protein BN11_4780005 [Tetrasphaera australiensis Ben110]